MITFKINDKQVVLVSLLMVLCYFAVNLINKLEKNSFCCSCYWISVCFVWLPNSLETSFVGALKNCTSSHGDLDSLSLTLCWCLCLSFFYSVSFSPFSKFWTFGPLAPIVGNWHHPSFHQTLSLQIADEALNPAVGSGNLRELVQTLQCQWLFSTVN